MIEIETEIVKLLADATEAEAVAVTTRGEEIVAGRPAHHVPAHFPEIGDHDLARQETDRRATVTTEAKETRAEAVTATIVTAALGADAGRGVTAAAAKAATITTKRRMVTTRRPSSSSK